MDKLINGFEHHVIFEDGRVLNLKTNRFLKPNLRKNGYYLLTIWEKNKCYKCYLHRIIAEAFIPNPNNKRTINHINGIKTDNTLSNLEWATYSENVSHAYKTNLHKSIKILSEEQIAEIYTRFLNHESFHSMLKEYNISNGSLSYHISKYVQKHNLENEYKTEILYQIRQRAKRRATSTTISKESTLQTTGSGRSRHPEKDENIV